MSASMVRTVSFVLSVTLLLTLPVGCEVSVLEEFSQLHSCIAFGFDMFVPHSGNDLLSSQEEFFWKCSSLSVDSDSVVCFD